jgi:AhpD family alkylhydroperoxidase
MIEARIPSPVFTLPGALDAMLALSKSATKAGVPHRTLELVHLRASQINGCGVCVDMHAKDLKRAGERDERIFAVAAWRDTPYFTDAERAALALTECVTRLADRADAVPDEVWAEAAEHYDDKALAALVVDIAAINAWNRLNVATRQVAEAWAA